MSDDRIRAVLRRAAEERAFYDALMENREAALDSLDSPGLTAAEKAILMAPTRAQLRKMVEAARKRPWSSLARTGFFLGGVAAAAGFTGLVAAPLFATLGHTVEAPQALHVQVVLHHIASAEMVYRQKQGRYGGLDELVGAGLLVIASDSQYDYEIELDGDTFTATARHRTRPRTRPGFQVGPDGVVKPVE